MAVKAILSFFCIKKRTRFLQEEAEASQNHPSKTWRSDEDRPNWYAEPDIDKKAKDYIMKVRQKINQSGHTDQFS
ncbi:hypothetical protein IEQ34_008578 [Dendrobium chrysotoxum]|uniref:Uncharacterized protein n=1 Tax=Dendrobium chrysotoxum TaxID=161865 RepID=A0AAV7GZT9_DENCH|nr:hypothetical protein IEQ34_008578 [Dendrobium chrysotoxum]